MEKPLQVIKRPGIGHKGERTKVRTNYFEVTLEQKSKLVHYDVTIKPEVPPRLNRKVFNRFVENNLGDARPVFDGKANMFANKQLQIEADSFDVILEEENVPTSRTRPPREFRITIRKTRDIEMEELYQFLRAKGRMTENCQLAITAMDIIISQKVSTKYPTVRRSFYIPQEATSLSGGLEAWQGYYQSARPTMRGKMMINIDLSVTVFYEKGPLVQMVAKILGLRSPNDLRRGLEDEDRQKVERIIKNLKISDNHLEYKRKFKIEKLTQNSASRTMFDSDDGKIDVKTYFQNKYNKRLVYPFLPCVVVRKNVYLPIEVCDVIPEQRYMRKLNKELTEEMMNVARQHPTARANKIYAGLNLLNFKDNDYLKHYGMKVSNNMVEVNARILPTPTIQYHQSSKEYRVRPKGGAWNLRDKKVAIGATLNSWSVLAFSNYKDLPDPVINAFLSELVDTCQDTGMNIPNRKPPILRENPIGDVEESLKKAWSKAGNTAKAKPQLILCILPNKGKRATDLYGKIKRVGETVLGVATQCIQSVHMRRPKKQYCANVCLKMNVKIGGENVFLIPDHIKIIEDDHYILLGADVTHPSPGDTESPSIAALCGSMNLKASRYSASIRVQGHRVEIVSDLANMVKETLKTFYLTCGLKPKRILFYRDGVSEGQFAEVLEKEVKAIRAACRDLEANYRPKITFVVVIKRHHTRFFPIRDADRSGNCLPGTVVDMDITHPFEFDFYLQSHAGLLGTSRPALYHVLIDENGFNADSLQTLTYNLCYIYARCTRAVSLVPPVYYAHLIAARARLHSSRNFTDTESSEEGGVTAASFGAVKEELRKVSMYYM